MEQEKLNEILKLHRDWLAGIKGGKCANLRYADLSDANLSGAKLKYADLRRADLKYANLRYADLSGASLSDADLSGADLSGADGLLSSSEFVAKNFDATSEGIIAYKTFGGSYKLPDRWKIKVGSIIEENVNPNRTDLCGCGINVAPLDWVKKNCSGDIWEVIIKWEWLPGVVVPYNTDGQIRCERAQLVKIVER